MSNNLFNSGNSSYQYVPVDRFTPNSREGWTSFGDVTKFAFDSTTNTVIVTGKASNGLPAPTLKIYILGPSAFRVRFNRNGDYSHDGSFAVVNWNLGAPNVRIVQNDAIKLSIELDDLRLDVLATPFSVQAYRGGVLISSDTDQGLEYIAGNDPTRAAVANFKSIPAGARYYGFGEKGGNRIDMLNTSMTFFNYDNYKYSGGNTGSDAVVPSFSSPGPLNYAEPLYNSIPFLIEDNPQPTAGAPYAYGLFFDNESQSYFNIGQSSSYAGNMFGKYYFGALYGEIDYYFMAGADLPAVLNQYTTLLGRAALPPMYVLGYHQGGYGYFNDNKVLSVAQAYRTAHIPLDGVHIDVDFQNNYRTFTASPEKFPDGGKPMFDKLHKLGVKASTNITGIVSINPDESGANSTYQALDEGKQLNVFYKDVRAEQQPPPNNPGNFVVNESYGYDREGFNPFQNANSSLATYGYYADLGKQSNREWWGTLYKPLLDAGLDMVWQDMTDPATQPSVSDSMPWKTLALNLMVWDETTGQSVPHAVVHNVFALNLVKATYDGLAKLRPTKRPFIIARGGYAGVHRYAASWTGDSASDWNFLAILIPEILNFGLSGQPLAGADVGGFAVGPGIDQNTPRSDSVAPPELLTRWTTLSAFIGWFRNHYDNYNKTFQEPYNYGFQVANYCRRYIEIRYKLLQYFYDAMVECTRTGLPICRPMFLTDRADLQTYEITDQFMVGNDIVVAPVVTQGSTGRDVYLPAGSAWFAYQDNKAPLVGPNQGGGNPIHWYVPLDMVPVYVRAGAIIPRRELEQYVGESEDKGQSCPLTFDIYPGPDSTHIVYLDDKVSTAAQLNLAYRSTEVSQSSSIPGEHKVRVQRTHDKFTPAEPFYFIALLQAKKPALITRNQNAIQFIDSGSDNASAASVAVSVVDAYYFSQSLETVFVKVFDTDADTTVIAQF
jgi:alpha-glucosidase